MGRPWFAGPLTTLQTAKSLFRAFRLQRMSWSFLFVLVIFGLGLFFAFLAFTPVLSPFVYPLF